MYDIVGDIHGYADELELLLAVMGYQQIDGVWQHPSRQLISVGDLIDRGPQQQRVVDIIRSMQERGFAQVILGNHEFNAIAFATVDDHGRPLRAHTAKNKKQHQKFLDLKDRDPIWYQETINWFKSLPILLDLFELRVVHACWHTESVEILKNHTDDNLRLMPHVWFEANDPDHPLYGALEVLMKGWELQLPDNYSFNDKDGHLRKSIRTQWWLEENSTYRDIALGVPDIENLPDEAVSSESMPGYDNKKPLFIGHYWLHASPLPVIKSQNVVCVDWCVADKGLLVAYRFSDEALINDNFITVNARPDNHFSTEEISLALYLADPMNTCCVENCCTDEYFHIAVHARKSLSNNLSLYDSIEHALEAYFEDMVEPCHVSEVLISLSKIPKIL